jgi:hypothetical protein
MPKEYPSNVSGNEPKIVGDDKRSLFSACPVTSTGLHDHAITTVVWSGGYVRIGVSCTLCLAYEDMPAPQMFRIMLEALYKATSGGAE